MRRSWGCQQCVPKSGLGGHPLPSLSGSLNWGGFKGPPNHPPLAPSGPDCGGGRASSGLGTELPSCCVLPTLPPPSLWVSRLPLAAPGAFGVPWPGRGQEGVSHVASEGDAHSE